MVEERQRFWFVSVILFRNWTIRRFTIVMPCHAGQMHSICFGQRPGGLGCCCKIQRPVWWRWYLCFSKALCFGHRNMELSVMDFRFQEVNIEFLRCFTFFFLWTLCELVFRKDSARAAKDGWENHLSRLHWVYVRGPWHFDENTNREPVENMWNLRVGFCNVTFARHFKLHYFSWASCT